MAAPLPGCCGAPDWRDPGGYAWLLAAGRPAFAWEWLRRSDTYRRGWQEDGAPLRFGLVRAEPPELDARAALPLWSHTVDPLVLRVSAIGLEDWARLSWAGRGVGQTGKKEKAVREGGGIDLTTLPVPMRCLEGEGMRHLLLGDFQRSARVDLLGDAPLDRPIILLWHLAGLAELPVRLCALHRLVGLCSGEERGASRDSERRSAKWILGLRCADALVGGASQQVIARELFGALVPGARWRVEAPSIRLRTQRLVVWTRRALRRHPRHWLAVQSGYWR